MEILLIDLGALGIFLGYVTIVYWHAVTHEVKPRVRTEAPLRPGRVQGNARPGAAAEA